jgi:hypothetical protein
MGQPHHVEEDLTQTVKTLKKAKPRGLLVGSPKLSALLQRLDLVDEYRFVAVGHGPLLFCGLLPSLRLKFVTATRLESGIVALHYRRPYRLKDQQVGRRGAEKRGPYIP